MNTSHLKHLTTLIPALCLSAGCVAPLAIQQGHTLVLRPEITPGLLTQASINPYTSASIQHLLIKLFTYDGADHDLGISQDLLNAQLGNPITFSSLKANTTYRIKAFAYKAAGTAASDLISTNDANSYVDVTLTNDDRPSIATLNVKLIDIGFNGQATSTIDITPGTYTPVASESSYSQYPGFKGIVTFLAGSGVASYADGTGTNARFNNPWGMDADSQGNLFICDRGNHCIRKVTPAGVVTTFAGAPGTLGFADGTGTAAKFNEPHGLVVNRTTNEIYVADCFNDRVRKITTAGVVTTLVGNGTAAWLDGTGTLAEVCRPVDLAIDQAGTLYLADYSNNRIRKITSSGVISTLAGGTQGHQDGFGSNAQFYFPYGITLDPQGNLYVAESKDVIRKVTPLGEVTTIAGQYNVAGSTDGKGTSALFYTPVCLEADANGYLFIPDLSNHRLRLIDPTGNVSTFVGSTQGNTSGTGTAALLNQPHAVTLDNNGNLYLLDYSSIRKIQ